jgi:hypothetical protein
MTAAHSRSGWRITQTCSVTGSGGISRPRGKDASMGLAAVGAAGSARQAVAISAAEKRQAAGIRI